MDDGAIILHCANIVLDDVDLDKSVDVIRVVPKMGSAILVNSSFVVMAKTVLDRITIRETVKADRITKIEYKKGLVAEFNITYLTINKGNESEIIKVFESLEDIANKINN